jgi:hypothetical protein
LGGSQATDLWDECLSQEEENQRKEVLQNVFCDSLLATVFFAGLKKKKVPLMNLNDRT